MEELDHLDEQIQGFEERMADLLQPTRELGLIETLPGAGFILGVVILTEVGDVRRFPSASHLASYSGMAPRVHASGGRVHYGATRSDVNRYLKWAYAEAANAVMIHRRKHPERHVSRPYERMRRRSGHQRAVGRHLAEATYWMLRNGEPYEDPFLDWRCTVRRHSRGSRCEGVWVSGMRGRQSAASRRHNL